MGRTMAVVLFTDLVGSTELRGLLGEEPADELRRKHDQLLAQVVEANNGRVVKGLGDGIMAAFGGASDAVAAAVASQQSIDRLNRSGKLPVPLSVRVGLSAGDVSFEDDDVHGTPVIEAARLCGAAVGGEILASEIVRWLGGAQGASSFIPVGSLELKGVALPVPTLRIEWEPAPTSTVPMPALLTDIGRIFVGRDAELERLAQLWKEAAAGERRVAFLAGEPGVGKTRLAAELAIRVHGEGGVVLAGRCDEDMGVPYQPFVEALRHFVDHSLPSELKERLGRYAGELVRLVPDLSEQAPDLARPLQSDPETERYRLFDAVTGWLSAASAEDALVLVLDDLQWAAKPTLLLLRHIVRAPGTKRLLILGTYRDTELTHDHPLVELMADLRREAGIERLSLSGLDDLGVAAYVERAAGQALDDDGLALAQAIHEETEGNPFFVREVIRHLLETNAIARDGDRWTTSVPIDQLGIPEGVREVVGRRLARLSGSANQALWAAAVMGFEFEVDVVRAAADMTEHDLLAALDEAAGARLVSEASPVRFRFSHAVVRATLYESLSGARRIALHRAVAQALEALHAGALDDYLPALAHHWARASASAPAVDTARAVDYAVRAGDRALTQLAHDEAVGYYRQALELLDSASRPDAGTRRCELLVALGDAQRRAGDPAHRGTLFDAARLAQQLGDPDALAGAALASYRGFFSAAGLVDAERVALLEAALHTAATRDDPVRARLLATLAVELHFAGDSSRRRALSNEALTIARRSGDPTTLAEVLHARCPAIWEPSTLPERLANTEELLRVTERAGDPAITTWAWVWRFCAATEQADRAESDRSLDHLTKLAAELRQPMLLWVASYCRTGRLLLAGRFGEAEHAVTETREVGVRAGQPDAHMIFGVQRYQLLFEQGRLNELAERLRQASDERDQPVARAYVALAYCELDQVDDARRVFAPLAAQIGDLPDDLLWLEVTSLSAAVCASLGDRLLAARLHDRLVPYSDQLAGHPSLWWGSVSHYLGLLAATLERYAEAEAHFAAAQRIHEQFGAPTWLARTRVEWARILLSRRESGDAERARELLGQALTTARALGLANVERRAVELLR